MRRIYTKLVSAGMTVLFFVLLRPTETPAMWIISLFTLMFYVTVDLGLTDVTEDIEKQRAKKRRRQSPHIDTTVYDMRRWADTTVGKR